MTSFTKGFGNLSSKHVLVDKANSTVLVSVGVAAVALVFCLFASLALIEKISYQNKVIDKREVANKTLEANLDSTDQLVASFSAFDSQPESVIGTADNNSKIVLDALPSKYDFPALATSIDGLIRGANMKVISITGTDDEVAAAQSSINPLPIAIPFQFIAEGNYESTQKLIADLQRSIRPFKIIETSFSIAEGGVITVTISGETAYQPSKELGIQNLTVDKQGNLVDSSANSASQGANQ